MVLQNLWLWFLMVGNGLLPLEKSFVALVAIGHYVRLDSEALSFELDLRRLDGLPA